MKLIKARELIKLLEPHGDATVVLAVDGEGNDFKPLFELATETLKGCCHLPKDVPDGPCVVLWPI